MYLDVWRGERRTLTTEGSLIHTKRGGMGEGSEPKNLLLSSTRVKVIGLDANKYNCENAKTERNE